ncbi:MAG: sigma-70 family RNA polymerase sigma factor [Mariniblastus sp.]|nr:sigma-70 family RNA polymerase sigma factor [Mariniblastus sp.]
MPAEPPILHRVASGQSAAVADCINQYGGLVWSLARRFSPDVQAAEDAVQDIFVHLWKSAERFDPKVAAEKTFVAMIARRRLIDISRRKSWPTPSEYEFERMDSKERSGPEQAELKDEAAKAAKLLDELPEDQRKVIRMSIYDGMTHTRISEATGLSLGTVKTHIRRGLLKLRQSLHPASRLIDAQETYREGAES